MRNVPVVEGKVALSDIAWNKVMDQLASRGWARLVRAVAPHALEALEQAAPGPWSSLPETEGSAGVRQAGLAHHSAVDEAAGVVQSMADGIRAGIDGVESPGVAPLPTFNHAEWCRAETGQKFITPHRDPDTAGGVIAVLTIRGRAVFRIWDLDGSLADAQSHPELATSWESEDGDLVLMRGGGWPLPTSKCPIHEAESPREGDRVTLTLRHNKGGYGADYFS
jgi:hypothetical protein